MSTIDKELARDITVAWINCGKLSEEYLTKKQVAAFYETMFQTISECKIQSKGVQVIDTPTGTITATTSSARVSRPVAGGGGASSMGSSSNVSKHRF